MSDRPWLEDGDPSLKVERELLKRLKAQQPPAGSEERGWGVLSAQISGLGAMDSSGAGPVDPGVGIPHALGGSTSSGIVAKLAVGMAITGGVWWGGTALLRSDDTRPSSNQHQRSIIPTEAPRDSQRSEPESVAPVTEAVPSVKQPAVPARPTPATTLAEEGRLLAQARQLVQSGQGHQALEVLRTSETRYPRSALHQEREVLTIEALSATGASGAARQRAERFLKRYPGSPHATRLQRFVE